MKYFDQSIDLKTQYRKLSSMLHPDKGGSKEEFQNMLAEYNSLRSEERDSVGYSTVDYSFIDWMRESLVTFSSKDKKTGKTRIWEFYPGKQDLPNEVECTLDGKIFHVVKLNYFIDNLTIVLDLGYNWKKDSLYFKVQSDGYTIGKIKLSIESIEIFLNTKRLPFYMENIELGEKSIKKFLNRVDEFNVRCDNYPPIAKNKLHGWWLKFTNKRQK